MARRLRPLRSAVRIFWGTLLFGIISLAVVVQLGRAVFPVLDDYRDVVEGQLSEQMQVDVVIGAIEAQWQGLRPQLRLLDVVVNGEHGEPAFKVRQVDIEISLLSTLRNWRLALRKLTFSGLSATLQQSESGGWAVRGLDFAPDDLSERDRFSINDPLDIFLFGRRVEMLDTSLNFHFRSGLLSDISIPTIRLENDAEFHRLAAEFSIDRGEQALALTVEGQGDPRDPENFDASGYLTLTGFPSEKVLAAFGIANDVLLGDEAADIPPNWQNTGQVDLRLWFSGTSTRGLRWRGDLDVSGVPVIPPEGMLWPESLHTNFGGEWHPDSGWYVDLADLRLHWPEFNAPPLNLRLRGRLGEPNQLQAARVDLDVWHQIFTRAGLLPQQVHSVLEELAPYGHLRNLLVTQTTAAQGYFNLQADVERVGVYPWRGVPAVAGINGYIEASAFDGHVVVNSDDGVTLDFPKIYHQPLPLQTAKGDVRWRIDLEQRSVAISSGTLTVSNDDITAVGNFNLRLPFTVTPGVEPELTLAIGVRKGAATLHRLLVPYTVPDNLSDWLNESVKSGVVTDASFIYHGSLLKDPHLARVIQLSATVGQGELVFDQNWPALTDASAAIVLDDEEFYVTHLQGRMMGVDISNAEVTLEQLPKERGRAILLRGDIKGDSGSALNLLKHSPVKDILGEQLSSWQLSGPFSGRMEVLVPLKTGVAGARQAIDLQFADNRLYLPQLDLELEHISGPFTYSSENGIASDHLSALLWGQPVEAQLSSQWTAQQKSVQLDFEGQMDTAELQRWSKRPELSFARGVTSVSGRMTVPIDDQGPLHLRASSMLQGVHIDLPPPLHKTEQERQRMDVNIYVHPETLAHASHVDYDLRLQDQVHMRLQSKDSGVTGIHLSLGMSAPRVEQGRFNVSGALAEVDLMAWNYTFEQYLSRVSREATSGSAQEASSLPVKLALEVKQMQVGPLDFESLSLVGGREQDEWVFDVQSPGMAGRFLIAEGQPLGMRLSYLRLPHMDTSVAPDSQAPTQNPQDTGAILADGDSESGLAKLEIANLSPIDFYCDELTIGDRSYGRWQFNLRPISGGLVVYDLTANIQGTQVRGLRPDSDGAELVWLRSDLGDMSYFSGRVSAGDVGALLANFGQERVLTSDDATFGLELQWAGAPDAVGLNKLLGFIHLDLHRGRFIRGAEVGENPVVKLLGLLNFDTLARRLRLDFSDLNPEGLGYERVQGRLTFKEGIIEVNKPLRVDSPASHIQFAGDINLLEQTVDAQLITTFPITGNLTMAAALTGVLPAAVGVFVVGKLFKEQLDRASSIRYSIDGSWHAPKVEVEKVFENQTNRQRARVK